MISTSLWDTAHRDTKGKLHRKHYFCHCFKCLVIMLLLFILVNSEGRGLYYRISLLSIWTHLIHYSKKFFRALPLKLEKKNREELKNCYLLEQRTSRFQRKQMFSSGQTLLPYLFHSRAVRRRDCTIKFSLQVSVILPHDLCFISKSHAMPNSQSNSSPLLKCLFSVLFSLPTN